MKPILISIVLTFSPLFSDAAAKPLFEKKTEVFKIVNDKSQTPTFRVLSDSLTKKSLAMAINAAYGLSKGSDLKPYVEVKVEKLTFEPVNGKKDQLSLTAQVSGHPIAIEETISREDFVSGKRIELKMPKKSEEFNMMTLTSQGKFAMKYQKSNDTLLLEQVTAKVDIASPLGDTETESLDFKARGLRQ